MASFHIKNNGYLLLELLIAISILMTLLFMGTPGLSWHRQYYAVDAMTREIIMDLHQLRQQAVGNGLGGMDDWCLSVRNQEYRIVQNGYIVYKKQSFSNIVDIPIEESRKDFRFDEQGKPKGKNMRLTVRSTDGRYERRIIIAAQTGRIRVE